MASLARNAVASCSYTLPRLSRTATTFFPGDRPTINQTAVSPLTSVKPASPTHYTGEPGVQDAIQQIDAVTREIRSKLREGALSDRFHGDTYGILARLGVDQPIRIPPVTYISRSDLAIRLNCPVSDQQRAKILSSLDELKGLLGQAALFDRLRPPPVGGEEPFVVDTITEALEPYISGRSGQQGQARTALGDKPTAMVDAYGRASAKGRRKSARATVWMIAAKAMRAAEAVEVVEAEAKGDELPNDPQAFVDARAKGGDAAGAVPKPLAMYGLSAEPSIGRVLVNNMPLVHSIDDPNMRHVVLQPFAITQTLGDYNVFALVSEGGPVSQAHAVAQGVARCLFELEGAHAKEILVNCALLSRCIFWKVTSCAQPGSSSPILASTCAACRLVVVIAPNSGSPVDLDERSGTRGRRDECNAETANAKMLSNIQRYLTLPCGP